MIHEILPVGMLACNCSIVGDERTDKAVVIDPGDEIESVEEILKRRKPTPTWTTSAGWRGFSPRQRTGRTRAQSLPKLRL
jgi:hypothetical protein